MSLGKVTQDGRHWTGGIGGKDCDSFIYYIDESVLLGTKPLLDSIRHVIRDPSGVFSLSHLRECRIVQ